MLISGVSRLGNWCAYSLFFEVSPTSMCWGCVYSKYSIWDSCTHLAAQSWPALHADSCAFLDSYQEWKW